MPVDSLLNADVAQHLIVFGILTTVLVGLVVAILRGWRAIIGEIKNILSEHEVKEEKWQVDIKTRLEHLEKMVNGLRDHLLSEGIIKINQIHGDQD